MTTNKELEEKGFSEEERKIYWDLQTQEIIKQKIIQSGVK